MALKWKLSKLYVREESSFAVDPDADGSDYSFLAAFDCTFQPQMETIDRQAQVNKFTRQSHVMGAKKGVLNFKTYLKASGLASAGVAAQAAESDPLLKAAFGQVHRGTSTTITGSGSTTTVLDVTSAADLVVGMMVRVGSDIRFITAVNTAATPDNITLDRAVNGSAPVAGSNIYASSVYRPLDNGHVSLAFCFDRDGHQYTALGCTATFKITGVNAMGLAVLEWTVMVADWATSAKASLATTVPTGITAVRPPAIKGAPFAIGGTDEPIYGFEFDPGIKFEHQDSTMGTTVNGDGNIFGHEKVDGVAQGVVKAYYAAAHFTDFTAGTERSLAMGAGTHLNGWGLYIPKVQYMQPSFEDHKGTQGDNLPFMVNDAGTTLGGYDFALSVF